MRNIAPALVSVRDLAVRFSGEHGVNHAVNGVSFDIPAGKVLGLLGESGSGKSVTMRALLRILPERRTTISGSIRFEGRDVLALTGRDLNRYRGGDLAMIFQDPGLALDPVFTIGKQIADTVMRHKGVSRTEARARALEMLEVVRIPSARARLDNYPHEMSGGMRQRAMIALALSCQPKLLLADEPTTALDATVQIQILLLLRDLQQQFGMSAIFVTHDVGVAAEISDDIAVMYAGNIVERGSASAVLKSSRHPYTQGLLASTIRGDSSGKRLLGIGGAPPDLSRLPEGCAFAPRCAQAIAACQSPLPRLDATSPAHGSACIKSAS